MAPDARPHTDRARGESFGSVAALYDRYRPGYADALIGDLAAAGPSDVLDVACGTGKAAVALASRGLHVLGVEVDERMATVARDHGIPVEVASFETWQDQGRRFDLVTCGQAWHWIEPQRGVAQAARVLRAGGALARFWNFNVLDDPVLAALDAVYREHAPELDGPGHQPSDNTGPDLVEQSSAFSSVQRRTYRWERTLTADDWAALVATYSDHRRLGVERLARLQDALHVAIERLGGIVRSHCGTFLRLAYRVD